MRVVIQRVTQASLHIENKLISQIGKGMVTLLGIGYEDTEDDINYLINKIIRLRIFDDDNGVMNWDIDRIQGEILLVSQFTLLANTRKGNRPSYIDAATPDVSKPLYNRFVTQLKSHLGDRVQTGIFGANMQVNLTNDGPVTIIIDSKLK